MKKRVIRIALTGGPCSGKTTSLSNIIETFASDFKLITVPEICTIFHHSGLSIDPKDYNEESHRLFTQRLCQVQIDLESFYNQMATIQAKDTMVVYDRGVVDNFAYTSVENKARILDETKWTFEEICSQRYDLVIHLVTAAIGAEEFYTLENNQARIETPEEARQVDIKILEEWMGHPNLVVIDNSVPGFKNKIQRVLDTISAFVGINRPKSFKKYLLSNPPSKLNVPFDVTQRFFEEEIHILHSEKGTSLNFIKKRNFPNFTPTYFFISKRFANHSQPEIETVKSIDQRIYADFLTQADPSYRQVTKRVTMLTSSNPSSPVNCNIEEIVINNSSIFIAKVFTNTDDHTAVVPAFLKTETDITNDVNFRIDHLTKIQ